jgi:PLP dependent protein
MDMTDAVEQLAAVRTKIAAAERQAGREPGSVTLVAVSKTFDATAIRPVLVAGQRVFGENRVQEARGRWAARRETRADLELRLVGPLQSNKAADACALFDVIETLDRESLAAALVKAFDRTGRAPRLLVQVNTGEEPQKAGVAPADLPAFLDIVRETHGLAVEGLMCIPPLEEPASLHFALLARLARRHGLETLSMGMSADYELAVRLGATSVRVGSALFGERT